MDSKVREAILAILDGAISACEGIAKLTTSTKDDDLIAMVRRWREMLRPIVGAESDETQS